MADPQIDISPDTAPRVPLRITVHPADNMTPAPPVGVLTNEQNFDDQPEDLETGIIRHKSERGDLDDFYNGVEAAGDKPAEAIAEMGRSGNLSGNAVAADDAAKAGARESLMEAAKAAAKDIGKGAIEAPRQIVGGLRDAAQSAIDLGDYVADNLEKRFPLGGFQLFNDKGEFAPERIPAGDPRLAADKTGATLPEIKDATTATGGLVRGVAQFLAGFAGAGGAMGGALSAAPKVRATVQGALASFGGFEGNQGRLSDLIEQHPALSNPVTSYLASNPEDSEAEGRFKNAIEGLGLGKLTEGLGKAVKYIRDARRARAGGTAAVAPAPEAVPLTLLGDDKAPVITHAEAPVGADKLAAAQTAADKVLDAVAIEGGPKVYINFARIDAPEDIKRVIDEMATAFKGHIDEARRGVRTNAATVEAAGAEDAWKLLMERRPGAPLNAEQSVAARALWATSAAKLMEVAGIASKAPTAENLFQFRRMMAIHQAIQSEVIAARTETARALQSWRIPVGAGPRMQMRAIEELMASTGGLDVNGEMAARVAALGKLGNGMTALGEIAEKGLLTKSLDVVKEIWINALLSGPKTHLVNTMSNTAVVAQSMVERAIAARSSQLLGSGDLPIGEAAAQGFGVMQGLREAFANAANSFRTGQSGFAFGKIELPRERALSAANFNMKQDSWLGRGVDAIGTVVTSPGRALTSADEFYKSIGYRMELNARAFRQASKEVLDGKIAKADMKGRIADIVANPPDELRLAAVDAAAYQTFTQGPGRLVEALGKLENRLSANDASLGEKIGGAALRFIVPFRNTPANIMKYTFERTPLAPLMARYQEAIRRGGADADMAQTRMALGTMTMMLAIDYAMDGNITGSGPKGTGETSALYRSGWRPYSFKVGDRYFAYSRLDPIGFTMGMGADLGEYLAHADVTDANALQAEKAMKAAALSVGNNILNKNYMRGLSDFVAALQSSEGKGQRWIDKFAGSFMPTGASEVARMIDPYMHATHDIISTLKSRTPGLSSELPMQRDLWGRPKMYQSGLGMAYDAVSPIYSSAEKIEPVDREMLRGNWFIGMPSNKVAGKSLSGHPEVMTRYLELQGQTPASKLGAKLAEKYGDKNLLDTLNATVESPAFQGMKTSAKHAMVKGIVAEFRKAARGQLVKEFRSVFASPASDEDEDE
jgi:hypothetical protein